MNIEELADKYRVAAPRYTSYPTVPYWDESSFTKEQYLDYLKASFRENSGEISLYIHLPFCESLCTYCGCNTRITKNHGVELPYIAAVHKEWQLYLDMLEEKPVIREMHLGGGTPTFFHPQNLAKLITGLLENTSVHPEAEFSIEGHPGNTSAEHLSVLSGLGFSRLSLGIQDFDPKVQFIINRIQSYKSVADVTQIARDNGFSSINYDLVYGLPLQQLEGLAQTVSLVLKQRPDRIAFYSYAHTPWVRPGQRRYTEEDLPSPELKKKLYELGRKMLTDAGYAETGMDHFTLSSDSLCLAEQEGRLHRNFMGYTTQHSKVLIGLGVSAISDSWNAFAQNEKTVEAYMQTVNQGHFPVFKGHLLDEEDLLIRQHVLNIMCKGKTSWDLSGAKNSVLTTCIRRAGPLAQDGLIVLSDSGLEVTATGKRFLRNICMAFDARLWAKAPKTQLFSMAD